MQNQMSQSKEGFSLDELFASEGDGGIATLAVFILKLYEELSANIHVPAGPVGNGR